MEKPNKSGNAPNYPTLENYDKSAFEIEGATLKKYKGEGGRVEIPIGVTKIGEDSFCNCVSLESVLISQTVTAIGYGAFYGCANLQYINLHEGLISIGVNAFGCCESLKSIIIPKSVISVGAGAFARCKNLKNIGFEIINGWAVSANRDMQNAIEISAADPVKNARLLTTSGYYWKRYDK